MQKKTHSFCYSPKKYDFEDEEDYKEKYIADEQELARQKQKISQYFTQSLKEVKELDNNEEEEQNFLYMDDRKRKKKNKLSQSLVSQSLADRESAKIKYPIYSSPILPYASPIKIKSPSQRFKSQMDYLDQELQKQDYYSNKKNDFSDTDTDIFDFNDDISSNH